MFGRLFEWTQSNDCKPIKPDIKKTIIQQHITMKKSYVIVLISCLILSSCGCGPEFLYNWRPKPWVHPFVANTSTGLDTLININGYYVSPSIIDTTYYTAAFPAGSWTKDKTDHFRVRTRYSSILFYNNGLCVSSSTRVGFSDDDTQALDTLYNNQSFKYYNDEYYRKSHSSWGTYKIHNDTIKTFVIENLTGCDGTRKNIISKIYLISNDKQLKQIFISNSNKEYGYKKILNVPNSVFYPIENKRDSMECPYLTKKWFYKKDKIK